MKKILILILLWLPAFMAMGQGAFEYNYKYYEIKDGLCDQYVLSTYQDSRGFQWFCTSNGLDRFDGHSFVHFSTMSEEEGRRLASDVVNSVIEDNLGDIWIASPGGVTRLDTKKGTAELMNGPDGRLSVIDKRVLGIVRDSDGDLWLGTIDRVYLVRLDERGEISLVSSSPQIEGVDVSYIYGRGSRILVGTTKHGVLCFNKDVNGRIVLGDLATNDSLASIESVTTIHSIADNIWVGTVNGLYCYNTKDHAMRSFFKDEGEFRIADNHVTTITSDSNGNLFVGTTRGMDIISQDNKVTHIGEGTYRFSLNTNYVNHIRVDSNDQVWVSTLIGGVNQLTPKNTPITRDLYNTAGNRSIVSCVYQDNAGNIFAGILGKGLAVKLSGSDDYSMISLKDVAGAREEDVFSICQDHDGRYWLGSRIDGLIRMEKHGNSFQFSLIDSNVAEYDSKYVYDLVPDSCHRGLWLCTRTSILFYNVDQDEFQEVMKFNQAHCFYIDSRNNLWAGGYGLLKISLDSFDPLTGRCERKLYSSITDDSGVNSNLRVTSINQAGDGDLYVGTQNLGIYRFRENREGKMVFEPVEGLMGHDNFRVSKLISDLQGNLWAGTVDGIYCYDIDNARLLRFMTYDGLSDNQCYINSGTRMAHNHIAFGTINGLTQIIAPVNNKNIKNRTVSVTGFKNEKLVTCGNLSRFDIYPAHPSFDLFFSSLDYLYSDDTEYAYRIKELSDEWNVLSSNKRLHFDNLKPGKYTVSLKCTNMDFSWSDEETTISIHVHPKFYQTFWFMALLSLFVIFSIILYAYHYRKIEIEARRRLSHEVKERTQSLSEAMETLSASQEAFKEQNVLLKEQNKEISSQKARIETYLTEVERLNKEKQLLYTNLTHELKTPLTLIMGPAGELESRLQDDEDLQVPVQIIKRSAKSMLSLVNQIMDVRVSDAVAVKVNRDNVDMDMFIDSMAQDYSVSFKERSLAFDEFRRLRSRNIVVDRDILGKVINNLMSNAEKYTPDGGKITFRAALLPIDDSRATLYLSVSNTGSYIDESEYGKIFDCFYKISGQRSYGNLSSSGVGLYLVKRLVNAAGGQIHVKSDLVRGTSFRIVLPVELNVPVPAMPVQDEPAVTRTDGKSLLLIVEDNDDMVAFIKNILGRKYDIIVASDGESGLEAAVKHIPDFIISDLMMPRCNGVEFCRRLRQNEAVSHIPFLMLTAISDEHARLDSYSSGVDAFLTKPFMPDMLIARIDNILNLRKQKQTEYITDITRSHAVIDIENPDEAFKRRINDLMQKHYQDPEFGVTELQTELCMSSTPFYKKVYTLTGLTPSHLIRLFRLQTAKKLLEEHRGESGLSISEVAYMVGFNDPKYFSRCFSKQFGEIPSSYLRGGDDHSDSL